MKIILADFNLPVSTPTSKLPNLIPCQGGSAYLGVSIRLGMDLISSLMLMLLREAYVIAERLSMRHIIMRARQALMGP